MEIISTVAMVSINETLVVQLISFLIFLYLINRIMFRPLKGVMRQREEKIDHLGRDIEDSKTRLEDLQAQLKEQERAAVDEANAHKSRLENEGAEQARQILDQSQKEIASLREQNEAFIRSQIAEARKSLHEEARRIAVNMMEKILDRRLARE